MGHLPLHARKAVAFFAALPGQREIVRVDLS